MLAWFLIAAGVLWLAAIVINNIKAVKNSVPSTVQTAADKIDDYADIVAGMSAAFALTAIAKKRGNSTLASQVGEIRVTLAKLADDTIATV